MDFYQITESPTKTDGLYTIGLDFTVRRSRDLMVRGKSFYGIWDSEKGLWSTDEFDVQRLIDMDVDSYVASKRNEDPGRSYVVKRMSRMSSGMWSAYCNYISKMPDNYHQLDENLTFANTKTKKTDYISRTLPYSLEEGDYSAYEEMMSTLYDPEERQKLEWAIGAIIAGDAKTIQKFIVLYGETGSGKSTFLNIVQKLFAGYYSTFEAKALTTVGNQFSMEVFKSNPLVAIQHDGDLSKIEDNTRLNSIVSHEEMTMNEKNKPQYTTRLNCFLFMGTNKPVKITDAKSGIIRRLIDVRPSLRKVPTRRYHALLSQIDFELGAIASHCLSVYQEMGKNYYANYRPIEMIYQTDVFFNFVESNFYTFKEQDGITLTQAYEMYKAYCDDTLVEFKLPRHKFREELKSYFTTFEDIARIEGRQIRSYYTGFLADKFTQAPSTQKEEKPFSLVIDATTSLLDDLLADCPAQYAIEQGSPEQAWARVKTTLSQLDTGRVHYVRPPEHHIVIDFDIKDANGQKSLALNMEAASKWPPTYAELSKSGEGVHLHYNLGPAYIDSAARLERSYAKDIEIKVFRGLAALRRKLTKCNTTKVATINSGLVLKGESMVDLTVIKNEKALRDRVIRNLNKEIHASTKPSIDFIYKLLEDAYAQGVHYDLTDMRPRILAFAMDSTNQADYCIKLVSKMRFASEEPSAPVPEYADDSLVFYDVEVFKNLFVVVWKTENGECVRQINPKPAEIEPLLYRKLVGFNCRRYDNHILYARYVGYDNMQLYQLSRRIIQGSKNCMFGEAYNISYADIYDFASKKQSLKLWEIDLGIHHHELGLPWDMEVPESLWETVADYCCDDVIATQATFYARKQDFAARQILADLSGLTVGHTTQQNVAKIIFGDDAHPQDKLVYVDLGEMFPGYTYSHGKSLYRGEDPKEGGYIYAEPGVYENVVLLDVTSMHPTSLIAMNAFGPYTQRYKEILDARVAVKHKEFDKARTMLGGALAKYLVDESDEAAAALAFALKIIINSVYGFTSASFENKFKHPKNVDNIVAKRGALFMIDLKHAVQERGLTVAHIKTDSIKIPNATPEDIQFVMDFGAKYGYNFEHEATYDRLVLLNDASYAARIAPGWKHAGEWAAIGMPLVHPYVFKTLFGSGVITGDKEPISGPITFRDLCETRSVTTALYLDMNEALSPGEHDYHFVGKVGLFCPVTPNSGGGILLREKDGGYESANKAKGYRWLESEVVKDLGLESAIDMSYFDSIVNAAISEISKYVDWQWFISEGNDPMLKNDPIGFNDVPPWEPDDVENEPIHAMA